MIKKLKNLYKKISRLSYKTYNYSYSQCGEDMIANYYLPEKYGFFVDIGAYHPVRISNTYHFYKKGWRGINIDGSKVAIALFNQKRSNDINLNCFIGKDEGMQVEFYTFNKRELNTGSKSRLNDIEKYHNEKPVNVERINVIKLSTILDKFMPEEVTIDLLNIDVEGFDLEVLESNNWDKYRPKVIIIEAHMSIYSFIDSDIHEFLSKQGYLLGGYSMHSYVFHRNSIFNNQ